MPDIAWLNGKFMPLRKAQVSVMDRGFLFGDGIYEVIRTWGGRPIMVDEHLRRLVSSARMMELSCPPMTRLRKLIAAGVRRAGYKETFIYIEITRGVEFPRGHVPQENTSPTVFLGFWRFKGRPSGDFEKGIKALTVEDFRWGRCDIKSVNLLANCMGKMNARKRGAKEVIFVHKGRLVEGGSSAVFVVKRGRLLIPGLSSVILPSLTRRLVLDTAAALGIKVAQRPVTVSQMMAADEVFLASTTAEGVPVVRIDGRKIGSGKPGEITGRLRSEILAGREAKVRRRS